MAARTRQLTDPAAIAHAVVARRERLGLTQDQACARSEGGISKAVWSLLENARQDTYRTRSLDAVGFVLNWPRDWIERIEIERDDLTDFVLRPTGNVRVEPVAAGLVDRLSGGRDERSFQIIADALEVALAEREGRYVVRWDVVDGVPKAVVDLDADQGDEVSSLRAELEAERAARRSEVQELRDTVEELIDQLGAIAAAVDDLRQRDDGAAHPRSANE